MATGKAVTVTVEACGQLCSFDRENKKSTELFFLAQLFNQSQPLASLTLTLGTQIIASCASTTVRADSCFCS